MQNKKSLSQLQIIAIGFFLIILTGTILLLLPFSTKEGSTTVLDAAFTAVSASCVTGLVVKDTYTHWTTFGQLIILTLIQIGGLGFASIGIAFALAFRRHVNLRERTLLQESISSLQMAGAVRLVKLIIKGTVLIEGLGAVILSTRFIPEFGVVRGIYFSIFHSISAFCNGGFDLMGYRETYSSLCAFNGDPVVILTIGIMILVGGMGFIVWEDIIHNGKNYRRYMLHTKIVLSSMVFLVVGGTIAFWVIERNNLLWGLSVKEQFLGSFFSAVTPRTAGFNSIDTAGLTGAGKLLTVVFMFIGGCPGSTAGGIKTTTVVVLLAYAISNIRNEKNCIMFERRISDEIISKAAIVLVINLSLAICGAVVIMGCHPEIMFEDIFFEVFSAIGTAGMSTGITRSLGVLPKLILMFLMYLGRIGSLTFALSFSNTRKTHQISYPEGKITVG